MSAEEFHSALQEATNFPLRGFVLPYLKRTLPSLQKDLNRAAKTKNQVSYKIFLLEALLMAYLENTFYEYDDKNTREFDFQGQN